MKDLEWRRKIEKARYIEREILKWYRKKVDGLVSLASSHEATYDIFCPKVGNVEVKEDRIAHQTKNYAIEYEDAEGKPSGIEITTAKQFVIVDWECVVFIATESLKYLINESKTKRIIEMGYTTTNGKQAKGWLIHRDEILLSPYAKVRKRWFK